MKIVVLIPCFNEEITIGRVVSDFTRALPEAEIIVFDNNSTDLTAQRAREAGATVYFERRQGKGYVVLRMFQDIDADVYVMVDGDCTYPAEEVRKLIEPILEGRADMVVGSRLHQGSDSDFRLPNRIGNYFFASLFRVIRCKGMRIGVPDSREHLRLYPTLIDQIPDDCGRTRGGEFPIRLVAIL